MNPADIRQMDERALDEQLGECHRRWRELRFEDAVGKLTSTSEIRSIRRTIAQIHTIRTEREMAERIASGEGLPHRSKRARSKPVHQPKRVRVGSGR